MISVTQPRRPADDFLASLQSNLQGNARTRRRRGGQQAGASDAVSKSKVAPKATTEQNRVRPSQQKTKQNRVKPDPGVRDRKSASKKSAKLPKATKSRSPELKPSCDDLHSGNPIQSDVQVEVVSSQPPHPTAPVPIQQPAIEVIHNLPAVQSYQYPVAAPAEDLVQHQQHNIRASQNNFYMKNQSNIFNTGFSPYQAQSTAVQPVRNLAADQIVLENALRIASQQPLPAPPTFSTPRSYERPGEITNQYPFVANNNETVSQQKTLAAALPVSVTTTQPQIEITSQDQSNFIHRGVAPQHLMEQTPTTNDGKPMNSHYMQSFSITGSEQPDNRTAQELERRKWVQELEAQVREKKERDERERMRQKSPYPAPLPTSTRRAAPNYQPVPTYSDPLSSTLQQVSYPNNIPQQPTTLRPYPAQNPNTHPAQASQLQHTIPSNTLLPVNSQQTSTVTNPPPQVLNLGPKSPTQVLAGSPTQGRMLGQGTWVDPVEMERRQEARKRALENQEMIKRQVEERERLKKEERDRIKREEELEMKRIEEEKRRMAEEVRLEQENRKKKEEAQLEQIAEMRRKIEEANKSAQDEKRSKRSRSAVGVDPNESLNLNPTAQLQLEEKIVDERIRTRNPSSSSVATNAKPNKGQQLTQALVTNNDDIAPVQETAPVQRPEPVLMPVRYVSNASTQTVHEVSCQTIAREDSFLPADSKLIQLQERELSVVQRKQPVNNSIGSRNNDRRANRKPKAGSKLPIKKPQQKKVPEVPKVQYDKNGRRIRPKAAEPSIPRPKKETPPPSNIIAEESEAITDYKTIADIFDDPGSPVMELESVGPSPYTVPDQQVQMRYTSPKNENRSIPSAISVRQNDILSQLEKLRMGLRDRRRHMSSAEIIQ